MASTFYFIKYNYLYHKKLKLRTFNLLVQVWDNTHSFHYLEMATTQEGKSSRQMIFA